MNKGSEGRAPSLTSFGKKKEGLLSKTREGIKIRHHDKEPSSFREGEPYTLI